MRRLTAFCALLSLAACSSSSGPGGAPGVGCWDLNGNNACDLTTEDRDSNGACEALDCVGAPGPRGEQGATGEPGAAGAQGPAGLACWDLDSDRECDLTQEDLDGNGTCTAADCTSRIEAGPGLTRDGDKLSVSFGNGAGQAVAGDTNDFIRNTDPMLSGVTQQGGLNLSGGGRFGDRLWARCRLRVEGGSPSDCDILFQLRAGAPLADVFRVDAFGGVVAKFVQHAGYGTDSIIPTTGNGRRLMWYPGKAAFRAGEVGTLGSTTWEDAWDDVNIGLHSWAGGDTTTASGRASLAFGERSIAAGDRSLALGYRASTRENCNAQGACTGPDHRGAVVISAGPPTPPAGQADFPDYVWATADNQFTVRAHGGIRLRTSWAASGALNSGGNAGCDLASNSGNLSCSSDKKLKSEFQPLDGEEVLDKLSRVPVTRWRYTLEPGGVWHAGPTAQDFHGAFGLGTDDTSIGLIDANGINMAAIQALEARTRALRQRNEEVAQLRASVARLASEREALVKRLERLEAAVNSLQPRAR